MQAVRQLVPDPRLHPILRFWESAYTAYRRPLQFGLGFHVPQFPAALLSPNFVLGDRRHFLQANRGLLPHFNEIVPLGHDQRGPAPEGFRLSQQFYLGEKRLAPIELPSGLKAEILPLGEAVAREQLWRLLAEGFGAYAPSLRVLLPFLATLEANFLTAFLYEGNECVGAVSVGVADGSAIVLNAVVSSLQRGRGLSPILTDLAQDVAFRAGAAQAFFWTEHVFFGRHADQYQHYRIFEKV